MNKPLWLANLELVSEKLGLGLDGGFIKWIEDHIEVLGVDEAILARLKAAPGTDENDVVVLSQLNSITTGTDERIDKLLSVLPFIVQATVPDVASIPEATEANKEFVYMVSTASGLTFHRSNGSEWNEFIPPEQQLITFRGNATLAGEHILLEDETTSTEIKDSHIYTYESNTVLKDNGADSGLETKLALLKTELETRISEVEAGSVKTQELPFDHAGLSAAAFAKEIPVGAKVVKTRVIIETAGDAEKANVVFADGGTPFSQHETRFNTLGISPVEERHVVAGAVTASATFEGTPTSGSGVLEITYSMPEA